MLETYMIDLAAKFLTLVLKYKAFTIMKLRKYIKVVSFFCFIRVSRILLKEESTSLIRMANQLLGNSLFFELHVP